MKTIDMEKLIKQRDHFTELTWRHLCSCLKSFEECEYLSSAIWAAVFVESLLKDILRACGDKSNERDELDALIQRTANRLQNDPALPEEDRDNIRDILRRAAEIRAKRNRLVHDTGVENTGLKADAQDVLNNVSQLLSQYLKTGICKKIRAARESSRKKDAAATGTPDFPVFISTITPHSFAQTEFIERFCCRLREIGVRPVRCTLNEFDKRDPMNKVRRVIKNCKAVIVIGLERSHTYYYRDKEGSENEREDMHRRYTSAWLQLESGMAIGMGKEVFVLCQKDLYGEGIFDRDWNTFFPMELSLPLSADDRSIDVLLEKLKEFMDENEPHAPELSIV